MSPRPRRAWGWLASALLGTGCGPDGLVGSDAIGPAPKTPAPTIPARTDGRTLDLWAARLDDPEPAARRDALEALGQHASAAAVHVDAVALRLADPDPGVRWAAAELVGRIGADAGAHAPALDRLLDDPVPGVRRVAARAAARVPALAPALARRLGDGDVGRRAPAKAALLALAAASVEAVEAESVAATLGAWLVPDDPARAEDVADVLAALGPAGVGPLRTALTHEDAFIVVLAAGALARLGEASAPAVAALADVVRARRGDARTAALDALVAVGAAARAALVTLSASPDAAVSAAATEALARQR